MELEEAWLKIKAMENSERFKPTQIHSILADFGVFKTNPSIRLVLKSALDYKLWEMVCGKSVSIHGLNLLRYRLEQDGFSSECIDIVLNSIPNLQDTSELINIDNEKELVISAVSKSLSSSDTINSNIGIDDASNDNNDRIKDILEDAKERLARYKNLDKYSNIPKNLNVCELHFDVPSSSNFHTGSKTKGNIILLILFGVFILIWLGFCIYCFIFKWTDVQWYDYIWGSLLAILGILPVCGLPWCFILWVCKQFDIVDDF